MNQTIARISESLQISLAARSESQVCDSQPSCESRHFVLGLSSHERAWHPVLASRRGDDFESSHTTVDNWVSRIRGQASRIGQAECRRAGLFPRLRKSESVGSAGTYGQTSYNAPALAPGG